MDEIDNIILHSLKQFGCNIDDDCNSLVKFTPERLVESVSKCITLINPNIEVPKSLGAGMAQRFGVTTALSEACKSLGFRGDIGYQTFLYSNIIEVRRVFMFLIEHIPKESEKVPLNQPIDKVSALENAILNKMNLQLKTPWMPHFIETLSFNKPKSLNISNELFSPRTLYTPFMKENSTVPEKIRHYWATQSPTIFQQTDSNTLIPSIIHTNDKYQFRSNVDNTKIIIGKIFDYNLNSTVINCIKSVEQYNSDNLRQSNVFPIFKSPPNIDNQSNTNPQTPLEFLKNQITLIKKQIDDKVVEQKELINIKQSAYKKKEQTEFEVIKLKEKKRLNERTRLLLQDPEVNIKKLKSIALATEERLQKLAFQWEDHRNSLQQSLELSNENNLKHFSKTKQIQDEIRNIKTKSNEILEMRNMKAVLYKQLVQEYDKINKNIKRNSYTSRILEIIRNISKQKFEIDKILKDTREIQKDINIKTGQLYRQFTVTDDLIFKSAKNDEYSKKSYKLLASLHADFNELIVLIQTTGTLIREVRDLGEQIENQRKCNISSNLERITLDLEQMKFESVALIEQIKKYENL